MRQPHEVLGVAENATPEEVAEAYRRLMLYSDPADDRLRKEIEQAKNEMDRQREVAEEARRTVIDDTRQSTATSVSPRRQIPTASTVQQIPVGLGGWGVKAVEMIKITLRWIAVLPVSFIGAFLVAWIYKFFQTLIWPARGIPLFVAECVTSLILGATFIYFGSEIAPSHKKQTTIALAIIGTAMLGVIIFEKLVTNDYKVIIFTICVGIGGGDVVFKIFNKES